MEIKDKRVVLTGAAGGMGSILARELVKLGANLAMVDANAKALDAMHAELPDSHAIAGDLSSAAGCTVVADQCLEKLGGIDLLINLAGINSFAAYEDENPEKIELMLHVNLLAPMWLARAFLPVMQKNNAGRIVNVGSIFGSIGFAYFAVYSASKFGLRGFSEALRREVADTNIKVTYIAPRAVKTPMNSDALMRMGEATGMNMDAPEDVVKKIIAAINNNRKDIYFGFPEALFVNINVMFPRLVDKALAAQNRIARAFAKGEK
ncbi:SDR family oxidoreductase [Mariprofundus sp. EBB-1]|uniref:SDR family oxidoreductase n=1 Tax=Mariprofundus sp. EBB-1 TaxID=2650971 RepID=UPI000EF20314|nr:SDR family oxidoreductase [Mariprofundus sp. EBB-1]RLL50937.1 SDR family oxidoreductase [Mariprofundus sp. EBB-1]